MLEHVLALIGNPTIVHFFFFLHGGLLYTQDHLEFE